MSWHLGIAAWDAVPGLSVDAISAAAQEKAQLMAFQGVNLVLMISRAFLLIQYSLGESGFASSMTMLTRPQSSGTVETLRGSGNAGNL